MVVGCWSRTRQAEYQDVDGSYLTGRWPKHRKGVAKDMLLQESRSSAVSLEVEIREGGLQDAWVEMMNCQDTRSGRYYGQA